MALQGVITPSIAGVYGVRDFSQQLANANAGVRNLANFALNQMVMLFKEMLKLMKLQSNVISKL